MANPDYVPETKVVLASYIHSNFITRMGFDNTSDIYAAEFDRWLEQHDAEIAKVTEERIIKLLEGLVAERKGTTPSYALLEAMALIKGDT